MENHILDLIPEYALDSLDREERFAVDRHIKTCESCRGELRAYREMLGELSYSVPFIDPPPKLKSQILNTIQGNAVVNQELPEPSLWQKFVNISRAISPAWALASILMIIILGAGNLWMYNQVSDLRQTPETSNLAVINMNGTETTPDAIGLIVVSKDGEHGTLIVDRLPVLNESQQYQLWLIKDGERTSGGVFSVSKDGYGSLWVGSDEPLSSYNTFGVTVEPFGGSPGPTGQKVLGSDA